MIGTVDAKAQRRHTAMVEKIKFTLADVDGSTGTMADDSIFDRAQTEA